MSNLKKTIYTLQRTLLLTLLVTLTTMTQMAQAKTANKEVVLKLWATTQIDVLLSNLKESIYSGEQGLLNDLDKTNSKKIRKIVDRDFATLKPHMQGFMIQRGNGAKLNQALKWFSTPLGQKISKQKLIPLILFSDPEALVPAKQPDISRQRKRFKKNFETLLYSSVAMITNQILDHYLTLNNHTKAPGKRLGNKKLIQDIKIAKLRTSGQVQQILPHTFDRNFSQLSLEELTVTMSFLTSEAGKAYLDLLVDAFVYGLTQTQPTALLSLSKVYENELSILSPYSKKKISAAKERQLMSLLIKTHGKSVIIQAMVEAKNGEMTIIKNGEEQQVFGRPNKKYITLGTLMRDLGLSNKDIREFYVIVQKKIRH